MLDRLSSLETFGIKLGLENISHLCEALGHPERSFTTLHVAGTNGKGSVTAMAHAALGAAGLRTARYTSPHLADITERFVIGDSPVDTATFNAAAHEVLDLADRLVASGTLRVLPTFFEATTAIAFELFRRAGVEVAVIEVGLGGRFDATNVITPVAGAITTIGFDHQQHLGSTLGEIAFEKAGIIKPGMTVVAGALVPRAMDVVRRVARERGATLVESAADSRVTAEAVDGASRVTIETPRGRYGPLTLALRGEHQIGNAVVATRLLEAAAACGVAVTPAHIERGLSTAQWPARLEYIRLDGGHRVLLDSAHNAEGAGALAAHLRRWHPDGLPLVVGIMRDKDVQDILAPLLPLTSHVVATSAPTPRALPAEELAVRVRSAAERLGLTSLTVDVDEDPLQAVERALSSADLVCVAGSIFLVGPLRERLLSRAVAAAPPPVR
ncbi:MAG TPA: folylpolyglutamate synthase/dihydrofolate synthase family protein [Vicinamibacterales bacterium]|nr:folylpolyglutamate synthase/dihydrofolate synthase family protein [Vicinamibacterales bacterium]